MFEPVSIVTYVICACLLYFAIATYSKKETISISHHILSMRYIILAAIMGGVPAGVVTGYNLVRQNIVLKSSLVKADNEVLFLSEKLKESNLKLASAEEEFEIGIKKMDDNMVSIASNEQLGDKGYLVVPAINVKEGYQDLRDYYHSAHERIKQLSIHEHDYKVVPANVYWRSKKEKKQK